MKKLFLLEIFAIIFISTTKTNEKDFIGRYTMHTKTYIDTTKKTDWLPYNPKDSSYYRLHSIQKTSKGMRNHYKFDVELLLNKNNGYKKTTVNDLLPNYPFISEGIWKLRNDSLLFYETSSNYVLSRVNINGEFDWFLLIEPDGLLDGKDLYKKVQK